jgi:hypothetical protein
MGENPICLYQLLPPNVFLLEFFEFRVRQARLLLKNNATYATQSSLKRKMSPLQLSSTQLSASQTIVSNGDLITKPEWSVARINKPSTNHTNQEQKQTTLSTRSKFNPEPKLAALDSMAVPQWGFNPTQLRRKERKTTPKKKINSFF